ncbi:MAG: class I SAM-dependent methyltransferase [Pseudomonadota bacterium]
MIKFKNLLFRHAIEDNQKNILSMIDRDQTKILLDLGCDSGNWTSKISTVLGSNKNIGVDIEETCLNEAKNVLSPVKSDLNNALPFKSNSIDMVHSNQVIEHLIDVDLFCEEIYRILKPGGCLIISTENLSSWHNLFALFMGRQAFSQHISSRVNLGNLMSLHYKKDLTRSWAHIKIFTFYGLKEFFSYYKFKNIQIIGAGYYPFWGRFSKIMAKLDPIHTHFITLKAFK